MRDPSIKFLVSDGSGAASFAIKYLQRCRFTSCIVYIIDSPKKPIGNYKVIKFSTVSERDAALLTDCEQVIP